MRSKNKILGGLAITLVCLLVIYVASYLCVGEFAFRVGSVHGFEVIVFDGELLGMHSGAGAMRSPVAYAIHRADPNRTGATWKGLAGCRVYGLGFAAGSMHGFGVLMLPLWFPAGAAGLACWIAWRRRRPAVRAFPVETEQPPQPAQR